ncbi:hypothetical protein SY83_04755 [Paenibacillus swuensis]|uniref:Uncharacterized protein n=1 Tax=Paenibacillus swuensis TaxID=1178515 RepID=A0A172TG11_9BACL|nr:hypothetical protein [Paenibacillus swuensis]ANE45723.1 hypothetical protein SY83_04755 [Paenibacillus swuensis]
MKKKYAWSLRNAFVALFCVSAVLVWQGSPASAENGTVQLNDAFNTTGSYQSFYLYGNSGGSFNVSNGGLNITNTNSNSTFGVYNTKAVSGHFYAEVDANLEVPIGLALVKKTNNAPDYNNWTAINIYNWNGSIHAEVLDRQNGVNNVRDNTGLTANPTDPGYTLNNSDRYDVALDGKYSLPTKNHAKKLRIIRNNNTGFFHYYLRIGATISGQYVEDWVELAPSKDWNAAGSEFYVMPLVRDGNGVTVKYDNLRAVNKPHDDQSDVGTGFKATKREYNWGGYAGEAVVVTFGDKFAYRNQDRKLVFWDQANYVPMWQLDDKTAFSYEFVESWATNGLLGCFEPMSDRTRRWTTVNILEDTAVRKKIHWKYTLINPNYEVLGSSANPSDLSSVGNNNGQYPEVDEYWTIYPDGTGTRHIYFKPKLDGNWSNKGFELSEPMVITNGKGAQYPETYIADTVSSFTNLEGNLLNFTKSTMSGFNNTYQASGTKTFDSQYLPTLHNWKQWITVGHLNNLDAYAVWNNEHTSDYVDKGVSAGLNLDVEMSWHDMKWKFGHFPINKEIWWAKRADGSPDYNSTFAVFPGVPAHTSMFGLGQYNSGTNWSSNYKTDGNGRKYREYTSLIGLSASNDYAAMRNHTSAWLKPGTITMNNGNSAYTGTYYPDKTIEFNRTGATETNFTITPVAGQTQKNPAFKITNWNAGSAAVSLNNVALTAGVDYEAVVSNGQLLLWLNKSISSATSVKVTP